MSLAASLIGLMQAGPAKFGKSVEKSFQSEVAEPALAEHSNSCLSINIDY